MCAVSCDSSASLVCPCPNRQKSIRAPSNQDASGPVRALAPCRWGSCLLRWRLTFLPTGSGQKVYLLSSCIKLKVIRRADFWDCKHNLSCLSIQIFVLLCKKCLSVTTSRVQMADKPMKRRCMSRVVGEMHIRSEVSWPCATAGVAVIRAVTPPSPGEHAGQQHLPLVPSW